MYSTELFTKPPHINSLQQINYSLNIAHKYLQQYDIASECLTLTDHILEVAASNLTPKTDYPQFVTALLGPFQLSVHRIVLKQTTTFCFDSLSNVRIIHCLSRHSRCDNLLNRNNMQYIYKSINVSSIGVYEANEVAIIVCTQQHNIC
jgi:hypothetical protein